MQNVLPPPQFTIFSLPPSTPSRSRKGTATSIMRNWREVVCEMMMKGVRESGEGIKEGERGRIKRDGREREGEYYHCLPLKSGCVHVPQVRLQVDPLLARQCKKQAFLSEQCTQGVVLFYLSSRPPYFWGGNNITVISQKTAFALLLTTQ